MHSNKTHHAVYLLKGPVLFSHFFILSEWAKPFFLLMFQIPSEHFYHISIIFLSYFTSVKSIIFLSVNTESMDIYGKRMRVTGLKKVGMSFFFRIKVKVRILRKTKQNNRSTLFFFYSGLNPLPYISKNILYDYTISVKMFFLLN